MKKYITLTLNPTIDIDYNLSGEFKSGDLNRSLLPPRKRYSGKGINISRLLKRKNANVKTYLLLRGSEGDKMKSSLEDEGLEVCGVYEGGEVRINVSIMDKDGSATEINDPGTKADYAAVDRLLSDMIDEVDENTALFLSGSVPPGCCADIYKNIISSAKQKGAYTALDCDGELMKNAVYESPSIIKPNRREILEYASLFLDSQKIDAYRDAIYNKSASSCEIRKTAAELCLAVKERFGCDVLCTLDRDGSVYVSDEVVFQAEACIKPLKGFKGAGDTFLAGFVWRIFEGICSPMEALMECGAETSDILSEDMLAEM